MFVLFVLVLGCVLVLCLTLVLVFVLHDMAVSHLSDQQHLLTAATHQQKNNHNNF